MSIIKINSQGLSNVTPILNNARELLEQASSTLNSITIPKTCTSGPIIKRIAQQISQESMKTISDLGTWVEEMNEKFEQVESKNASLLSMFSFLGETNSKKTKKNEGNFGTFAKNFVAMKGEMMNNTASYIGKNAKSIFSRIGKEVAGVGADLSNTLIATGAGVGKFVEGLTKVGAIASGGKTALKTYVLGSVVGAVTGNDSMKKLAGKIWKETMSYVSKDHVESALNKFYKDTKVGKALNKYAHSPFKKARNSFFDSRRNRRSNRSCSHNSSNRRSSKSSCIGRSF